MKCKAARKLFSAAFDGELSVSEEREFKDHLASCTACSREFRLFSKSVELVTSLPRPSTSPLFEQKLTRALRTGQTVPHRPRAPLLAPRPAVAFAAAMAFVALLVLVPWNQSDLENELAMNELAKSDLAMDGLAMNELSVNRSEGAASQSSVPSGIRERLASSDETQFAQGERPSFWSPEARVTSSYPDPVPGPGDALVSHGSGRNGTVLEIEFVLDPFFFEGAEVRRLDARSASEVEIELVSMTF